MKKQDAENLENLKDELFEAVSSLKSTKEDFTHQASLTTMGVR